MIDFQGHLQNFFSRVAKGKVEIYNEFSLQHEIGIFLRAMRGLTFKTQFERPFSFFEDLTQSDFVKKEIDIVVFTPGSSEKYAFELKYPRNGQYPEQMFKACQDIFFLEQLHLSGFKRCYFLMVADHPLFYERGVKTSIYKYFRAGVPIHGRIEKPTGAKDEAVEISGSYRINWNTIDERRKYAVVEID